MTRRSSLALFRLSAAFLLPVLTSVAAQADPAARPAPRHGTDPRDLARLFLSGPLVLLLFVSVLAVIALVAAGLGRTGGFVALGLRATERLERGRALPALWGLAAGVLIVAVAGVLFGTKVLALLGLLVLLAGFVLVGMGVGVAAVSLGRALAEGGGRLEPDALTALRLGLTAFFFAEFLPFVGWVVVLLAAASGVGALLEALLARQDGA